MADPRLASHLEVFEHMKPPSVHSDPPSLIRGRIAEGFRVEVMCEIFCQKATHFIEVALAKRRQVVDDDLKLSGGLGGYGSGDWGGHSYNGSS